MFKWLSIVFFMAFLGLLSNYIYEHYYIELISVIKDFLLLQEDTSNIDKTIKVVNIMSSIIFIYFVAICLSLVASLFEDTNNPKIITLNENKIMVLESPIKNNILFHGKRKVCV